MSNVTQVIINNVTYNIGQAFAKKQRKLSTMIVAFCAASAYKADILEIDVNFLTAQLAMYNDDDLEVIEKIVFERTFIHGEDRPISVDDFHGNMLAYYELLANCIKVNLQDFFTRLDAERASAREDAIKEVIKRKV